LACVVGLLAFAAASAGAASAHTYYVSQKTGRAFYPCTSARPCKTISQGVARASKGDTVDVEAGTYSDDVTVNKDIRVIGVDQPTVDLNDVANNGFVIEGSNAAGAQVSGFVVEDAVDEGILAVNTSSVTISDNVVRDNDTGFFVAAPKGECASTPEGPGDCGEAIHLMHVTYSLVTSNQVYGNTGGILLTDETGPTAYNTISDNRVNNNLYDCGITLAGHNGNAVASSGASAGVYGNTIRGNTVDGNGTKGEGGGVLMATGVPGGGVWGNLVKDNTAKRNGLAGVVIHSHAPGEDLNDNRIKDNVLSHNGLDDKSESEFGENNGKHSVTVDILLGSDVVTLRGIVVRGNTLKDAHYGVFTKNDAKKVRKRRNFFKHVAVKVKQT
jgi:nitrous oxidase accessory protein NosD